MTSRHHKRHRDTNPEPKSLLKQIAMALDLLLSDFMKNLILIVILAALSTGQAQDFRDNRELIQFFENQAGLFQVKLIPGDKTLKVYITGVESAKVEFDKLGLEASVFVAGSTHKLKVSRDNDHFNILRTTENSLKLDLKIDGPDKANTLRFDVPKIRSH